MDTLDTVDGRFPKSPLHAYAGGLLESAVHAVHGVQERKPLEGNYP